MIAPSGARPKPALSLRISVTDRCQLRCRYCMPEDGVTRLSRSDILRYEEIAFLVRCLQREWTIRKARISGGEPLVRTDVDRLVRLLAGLDIPDLALTTNAQSLAGQAPALARAGLRRINVSLDTLSPETFRWLSRGGDLARTLAGIDGALASGFSPLKLNMIVMRGINDTEVVDVLRFALQRGCELRFLELMPMGAAKPEFDQRFVPWTETRDRLARVLALNPLPEEPASSARRFAVECPDGSRGAVGFITPWSAPFCSGCNRLRITADGRIFGCLASADGVSVRSALRAGDGDGVLQAVREALGAKGGRTRFAHDRVMACTGG